MTEIPAGSATDKHRQQESVEVGLPRGASQPTSQMGFSMIPGSRLSGLNFEFISHQPGDLGKVFNLFVTQLPCLQSTATIRISWDCCED